MRHRASLFIVLSSLAALVHCGRDVRGGQSTARPAHDASTVTAMSATSAEPRGAPEPPDASALGTASLGVEDAGAALAPSPRETGPFELAFAPRRNVYFTIPASTRKRLIANLHGLCNPPGYACGYWTVAAKEEGFLVCPTGNATCGGGASAPPTWTEGDAAVDRDLEAAIAAVDAAYPGEMDRDGAILTGFSRGAYLAPSLAAMHPGRWPYLILNEANVALDATTLRKSGVRAVALIAGEWGGELKGERATVARLRAAGFPARLFVMPKAGHYYSANIDAIMADAITFVTHEGQG